jgi:microcystin-dependent protein
MSRKVNWSIIAIVLLAWLPTLGAPAFSALWQWSEVASSNGSADPQINFREGQPPSSINDSARAMMAALASYRDDISGLLTTTGTASAYSVSTNQNLCASPSTVPQDGQQLALTLNLTNGAAPTLTADACSTYPIQSAPGAAVGAATLIQGSPYTFRFSVANSAWMLRNFYGNPVNVPVGGTLLWWTETLPNGSWTWCNGQAISRTGFPQLFAMFGTAYGAGDGVSTFNLPDMREVVPMGLAGMGNPPTPGRGLVSFPGFNSFGTVFGEQNHTLVAGEIPTILSLNNGTPSYILQNGVTSGLFNGGGTVSAINTVVTNVAGGGVAAPLSVSGVVAITADTLSSISTNTGGGAHNNMQPSVTVGYIIRVM